MGFLAYFDSLKLWADLVKVPTANFEAVDATEGQPTVADVNFGDDLN